MLNSYDTEGENIAIDLFHFAYCYLHMAEQEVQLLMGKIAEAPM